MDFTGIADLLDPSRQIGLSAQLARESAKRVQQLATELGSHAPVAGSS